MHVDRDGGVRRLTHNERRRKKRGAAQFAQGMSELVSALPCAAEALALLLVVDGAWEAMCAAGARVACALAVVVTGAVGSSVVWWARS